MAGYSARRGVAQGVEDDLTATALVLRVDDVSVALVSCDLLSISDELTLGVRRQIQAQTGIPAERVLIAATHTHSGPAYSVGPCDDQESLEYGDHLLSRLAHVVAQAHSDLQPARVAAAKGQVDANINRRMPLPDGSIGLGENPAGIVDRDVLVIRVDALDGHALALVVNYAAHPVCLRPSNLLLSPDWVGHMRRTLEKTLDAPVLFFQGASGNLIPADRGNREIARRIGMKVAGEALKLFADTQTTPKLKLVGAASDFAHVGESLVAVTQPGVETALGISRSIVDVPLASESPPTTFRAEMLAIRVGDAALVAFPAEVFAEIGLAIKARSPFPVTVFATCANGDSLPYIPTAEAFSAGGYEVQQALAGQRMPAGLAPSAASVVKENALMQLATLRRIC